MNLVVEANHLGRRAVVDVLTLVLAGGKGTRLEPLTRDRAKPAVPFGGCYRIIDFSLSNSINSGFRHIMVLTQYKARSLVRHLSQAWSFLSREVGEYIDGLSPQQRIDENWYKGTADAIYQNIYTIEQAGARYILILSGDHIYKMDYREMVRYHIERGADLTVACIPVSPEEGKRFGILTIDEEQRVVAMVEKPADPPRMPNAPDQSLASMGIYVFSASVLFEMLCQDALARDSHHDFGTDIIPPMLQSHRVLAYPFRDRNTGGMPYWRDVG
ncbi:MAG: sugar phosphate nucleotidyltransferase, partial [Gemmataceae bacterium]